jgi:hypothetical protein
VRTPCNSVPRVKPKGMARLIASLSAAPDLAASPTWSDPAAFDVGMAQGAKLQPPRRMVSFGGERVVACFKWSGEAQDKPNPAARPSPRQTREGVAHKRSGNRWVSPYVDLHRCG